MRQIAVSARSKGLPASSGRSAGASVALRPPASGCTSYGRSGRPRGRLRVRVRGLATPGCSDRRVATESESGREAQHGQPLVEPGFLDGGGSEDLADHGPRRRAYPGRQSAIRARSQAEAAAFVQVGVVRLMLVHCARWRQHLAGQALVTLIEVQHRLADARSNRGADVVEGDCPSRSKMHGISPWLSRSEI